MSAAKTVVEVYEMARNDAYARQSFYYAASAKNFEERRFELSQFNLRRAMRWEKYAAEMNAALAVLRGYDVPW